MNDCLFCQILAGEVPSRRFYEDEWCVGFLDISPYHRGHSLVIPRRHVPDGITDPAAWQEVSQGLIAVSALLQARLGATGVNILSNAGAVSGQEIFHFHVHILPRYPDNPGMAGLTHRDEGAADDLDGLYAQLIG
ncbi:MAG: HIT domain-containing protein [Propionibacteriaceae bacterium]|jgi:histidine triad (HIT) family protein|nr:HIT domain-containing protein [Propionibacteriaceae bacterium]